MDLFGRYVLCGVQFSLISLIWLCFLPIRYGFCKLISAGTLHIPVVAQWRWPTGKLLQVKRVTMRSTPKMQMMNFTVHLVCPSCSLGVTYQRLDGMMKSVWLRWLKREANCGQQLELFGVARPTAQLKRLFLVELGALVLMGDNDIQLSLKDIYGMIEDEKNGCCRELFEAYRHLKSLGYIVGRHGVPWSMKAVKSNCFQGTSESISEIVDTEVKDTSYILTRLTNLQMDELRLNFDVYLPNSKFRKSSPGDPAFVLCLIRGSPPSKGKIETMDRQCGEVPLKLCHVDHGRVSFFSFNKVELPVLP